MLAVQEGMRKEFHEVEAGSRRAVALQEEEGEASGHKRSAHTG